MVNFSDPQVRGVARSLRAESATDVDFARRAFEFVRDTVTHSWDAQDRRVTLRASDVLEQGTGLCYAKAHLLTAILRVEGIPTGLCYQLLTDDVTGPVIHGLVAVYVNEGWHRQDPRGNKPGVDAQFSIAGEQLAWPVEPVRGERDFETIYREPSAAVVTALRDASDVLELCREGLPAEL